MPYISSSFIEKLESCIDIVKVIGAFVELKKTGAQYVGLSPWSGESTPSFHVSPSKEIFKDFSSGKGGNTIHFLMELKGWTYPEAIEYLAEEMKMPVEYDESQNAKEIQERNEKKAELSPLVQKTIHLYHKAFKALPPDHPAKIEIYERRKYTDDMVDRWEIGYAPGDRFLYNRLMENGMVVPAQEIGLIRKSEGGQFYDRYFNRVIYPIYNEKNKAIGLAGRDLTGEKKAAKWINPDDSLLYEKSHVLYGFGEARETIYATRTAYLVEGYNDVIAWHEQGIQNTVSASGTTFSADQIRMLKKVCDKVILMMDPDGPGMRATMKAIPQFLAEGFRVFTLTLPGVDPDDFVRLYADSIGKYTLPKMLNTDEYERLQQEEIRQAKDKKRHDLGPIELLRDGFGVLLENVIVGDDIERTQGARILCKTISQIEDEAISEIYIAWLASKSTVTKTKISKWVKECQEPSAPAKVDKLFDRVMYVLPDKIKTPLKDHLDSIERYQMFQDNNQIWMQVGEDPPYYFISVSNFEIEVVQHMEDEKFPTKLIKIKNIHKEEKIFDVISGEINTPQSFDKVMTDRGNYFYRGDRNQLQRLRAYLYDQMGTGRKIDVLGQQPEGFWVWNNKVTNQETAEEIPMTENGVVKWKGVSYYVPSANKIYVNNPLKYDAQKKIRVIPAPVSFQEYTAKMMEVHRDHAITGILFTIASMFQDVVLENGLKGFPIMFLYGPGSSGKDQMLYCCQSFFGTPQAAINLEANASTLKAQIREFAQYANLIGHLSEYKRGNPQIDGMLKGLWDRVGYKRGTIDSIIGSESIPIRSSVAMTGNDYPDNEPLITRQITEEMTKNIFTEEEAKKYEELGDLTDQGISSFSDSIIKYRTKVKTEFKKKYRMFREGFTEKVPTAKSRMIQNMSVLGAFYHIFKDELMFPFDHNRMVAHFQKVTEAQMRKMQGASIVTKWWDCYLASMRGHVVDRLVVKRDFKIENTTMYFNFTNVYNKVSRQWYLQYREDAPSKSNITDALRKDSCFVDDVKSTRIGETNTSAIMVNLDHISIEQELRNAMDWQLNDKTLFGPPATPDDSDSTADLFNPKKKSSDDMPF